MTIAKPGNPHELRMISFRADGETLAALEELANVLVVLRGVVARNKRSIAIRKAILEAHERLREKPTLTRKR